MTAVWKTSWIVIQLKQLQYPLPFRSNRGQQEEMRSTCLNMAYIGREAYTWVPLDPALFIQRLTDAQQAGLLIVVNHDKLISAWK